MVRQARHIYEFGAFRLIPEERQLLRGTELVPLTPKSFDLLVVLVENSGHLLEKGELMTRIWPDSFVEESNLSVRISALRRTLGEGPNEHQFVETVPGRGYRFVASVRERWEEIEETGPAEPTPQDSYSTAPGNGERRTEASPSPSSVARSLIDSHRWPLVLGGLMLFAVLVGLTAVGLQERMPARVDPGRIQSLAVLPLENLSKDGAQEYFADGMTEALINELAGIGELRVISLPGVMQYKPVNKPIAEVGRELKVDVVLSGSVLRSGQRVKMALQLMNTATGRSLWADSYDRDLRNVLSLQRAIGRDIADIIRVEPTPPDRRDFQSVRSVDPEAYDDYLRGRFYLNRQNAEGNAAAILSLERAVAIDPTFAAAHAELAQAYVWKLFLFAPEEAQLAEKAFVAAERALSLDPNSAVAYLARGRILWTPANHFPHEKAIREYRRALSLNPNLDEARNQLALVYCHIGAFDEALQESQRAVSANPNNVLAQFRIGQTLNFQGKYDQALAVLRAIPQEANPALVGQQMAWALLNLGREKEASDILDQFLRDYPEDHGGLFTSLQAILTASSGQIEKAEEQIQLAVKKGKGFGHFHHTAYHIACAYARMNKPGQAVHWLEVAADDGFPCYPLFAQDANLDPLRQDPLFVAFLAKLRTRWDYYKSIL
ncbi:MAG: winged helix-turn-helix domain-containing protein [Acidobacteriota bacterium]